MKFCIYSKFDDLTKGEMYQIIHNLNPYLLFLATLNTNKNVVVSASKYSNTTKLTLEKAFEITLNFRGDGNYKLLDYGIYMVNNKILRFKVSDTGTGTINLMYYFMKDENDYDLYELKAAMIPECYDDGKKILESIALTVEIY